MRAHGVRIVSPRWDEELGGEAPGPYFLVGQAAAPQHRPSDGMGDPQSLVAPRRRAAVVDAILVDDLDVDRRREQQQALGGSEEERVRRELPVHQPVDRRSDSITLGDFLRRQVVVSVRAQSAAKKRDRRREIWHGAPVGKEDYPDRNPLRP